MATRACETAALEFKVLDIERILSDEFIAELKANPEAALLEIGVEPTAEIVEALARLDLAELKEVTRTFYAPGDAKNNPGEGAAMP